MAAFVYDNNGNQLEANERGIVYTSYDQPYNIYKLNNQGERVHFDYNGKRERYQRLDISGGQARTLTQYLGNVERIETLTGTGAGIVEWKRYIGGAVYTYKTSVSNCGGSQCYTLASTNKSYTYNDHLGSLDVVVNHLGTVTHSASYNAWGERRSGETWTTVSMLPTLNGELALAGFNQPVTQRGYTGHEHVDTMGLIHMNGRTYDPKLGRFLQADPFIQAAGNTQSYNRYSYVVNNPLNKIDPSGYISLDIMKGVRRAFFKMIGPEASQALVGIGSIFCGPFAPLCAAAGSYEASRANGSSMAEAMHTATYSGVSAAAFNAIGGIGLTPSNAVLASAFVGGTMAYGQGGKFGHGFLSAGIGAAAGAYNGEGFSIQGFVVSSVAGGTASYLTGGKFGNGAASAAFSYAMTWGVKKYGPGGDSYSSGSTNMGDEGTAEERLATANKAKEVLATVYGKKAENIKFVDEYIGLEESSWLTPWKKIPKSFSSRAEFDAWLDEKSGRGMLHAVTSPTRKITIYRSGVIGARGSLYLPGNTSVTGNFSPVDFAVINMGHELWHASGSFGRETMMNDKPHVNSNLNGYSWCLALGGCRSLTIK